MYSAPPPPPSREQQILDSAVAACRSRGMAEVQEWVDYAGQWLLLNESNEDLAILRVMVMVGVAYLVEALRNGEQGYNWSDHQSRYTGWSDRIVDFEVEGDDE
jgi:hypothetical protein